MQFERQYDEFGGKRGVPPGQKKCLIRRAGWARGVLMVMVERGMKVRGANPGQRAPTRIEEHLSRHRSTDRD